jgi:3D (Asp-Asp-Asp) domain-containing protein
MFLLFGILSYKPPIVLIEEYVEEVVEYVYEQPTNYKDVYVENSILRFVLDITPVIYIIEEEPSEELNCLMYATEPIGRYYITAYNHEETGGKITASGTICHEGTITTCAGDVWGGYFKFGDYIEVDGRIYKIEDTGSAVKKKHIDLYFASYKEMARYGSNYQNIYRVTFPFGKPKEA